MRGSREPDRATAALHRGHRCSCSLLAAFLPTLLRRMPKVRCEFDVPPEKRFSTPLNSAELMPTGFRRPERAIAAIRPDLISIRTVRRPKRHVVPALLIALISLAYLEEDGLLLSIALLVASIVLTVELVA